jgi:pimeloyl-ACP methyl ester carboxylesterase
MGTFVLVHGAWHGFWCWKKVIPLLEKAGYKVEALDLPGHGENRVKPTEEVTLQDYMNCVLQVLEKQPEPVILVGHSMGGMVISQVAEYKPDKIKKLVYLCAFLLKDGESIFQELQRENSPNLDPFSKTDATLKELFYGDCSDADLRWAKDRLVPQPIAPVITPIHITDKNYGRIPRVYITCLLDKVINPAYQKQMYTTLPCQRVISMNTSHSPFLSAPEELVKNLISIAAS